MATIDLTLNGIKIPALDGYTPPFGTKKVSGGLTTQEVNDNVIAPFVKERPIEITEDSSTGSVEYNASLVINSANAVLTLGSGTYVGCTVKVLAQTAGSVSYNSGTTAKLAAGDIVSFVWSGSAWIKVTTNKVGSEHTITTCASDYTFQPGGACCYVVINGICFVSIFNITALNTTYGPVIYNLPKCKSQQSGFFNDGVSTILGTFYIASGTTTLMGNVLTPATGYCNFSYPVSDDWVEG